MNLKVSKVLGDWSYLHSISYGSHQPLEEFHIYIGNMFLRPILFYLIHYKFNPHTGGIACIICCKFVHRVAPLLLPYCPGLPNNIHINMRTHIMRCTWVLYKNTAEFEKLDSRLLECLWWWVTNCRTDHQMGWKITAFGIIFVDQREKEEFNG